MNATYYTASWCQPCKAFKPIAFRVMEEEGLRFEEQDVDTLPHRVVEAMGLMTVPTVVFWDETGNEHMRVAGAFPEPIFRQRVQQYNLQMREILG